MKRNVQILILLGALTLTLVLAACGSQPLPPTAAPAPTTAPTQAQANPTGSAPPTFSDPTNITNPFFPVSLTGQAISLGTEGGQSYRTYQSQVGADGAPQAFQDALASALGRLQTASADQNAADTMQAANDLSAGVIDLFALYQPTIPADVGRLDVLERQVVLDAAVDDLAAAADSLAQTNAVWARLKPFALQINGAEVAAQFDASLTTQATALGAGDVASLTAEANNGLELVDALEGLY